MYNMFVGLCCAVTRINGERTPLKSLISSLFVLCVLTLAWSREIWKQLRCQTLFPVAPASELPDVDSACKVATDSIAALLQPSRRSDAEMDAEDAPTAAVRTPAVCDLGVSSKTAVVEICSKRRKVDDVTTELMEGAAN